MSISESGEYDLLDRLAEEFVARFRRGERPALKEYTDRFPELADAIRELFPAMVKVEQAEGGRQVEEAQTGDRRVAYPPPSQIGDYRILREIGRGGMGVVYEAEQISLGRRVALKVLPGHVSSDPMVQERFRREARAAARLHHTNIVPVYEVGQDGDVRFFAMQFIQGQGLDAVIAELRCLRDRARSEPGIGAAAGGTSLRPQGEHAHKGLEDPTLGEGLKVSAVLRSILSGRFDPRGPGPPLVDGRRSRLSGAPASGLVPAIGTGKGIGATERDPDSPGIDTGVATEGDTGVPASAHPPAPVLSLSTSASSSSAILPGGTQLSSAESARRAFYRSLAQIGRQVAGGLAYAHARGIVHRDIKPSNLLLDTDGVVWIADFGLAKGDDEGLTQTGDILGTIRYMAPERFRGDGDARADVYALGLTLYELLTLRSGFEHTDRLKLVERIKTEEPSRPRSVDARIPRDLETIVLKAIEKEPDARYQTAEAMSEDLRRFLTDEPIRARPVSAAERYWRWARRNPWIAALGGVLTGVLVLATVISTLAAKRFYAQAEAQRTLAADEAEAHRKADEANASLRDIQETLRRTVYATRSNLALAAWDAADVRRLGSLLDLLRPTPGEPDLRGWEWRYLWQLAHEDRLTLRAQADRFTDVVFSPDGKTVAGLEQEGRIQLWDRYTGEVRRTMGVTSQGRRADLSAGVSALAFGPDGRSLAGPGPEASLMVYAVDSGLPTLTFEGSPGAVQDLAWSPDGRTLVAALSVHAMRVWDARDGHLIHRAFGKHAGPVAAVAFSPDGRTIASASYDATVVVWDTASGRELRSFKGHTDEVRAVAFSPDGRRIASAGLDRSVRLWDVKSGAGLAVIWGHTGAVLSLAYGPDGSRVVTGSGDETVRVWDTASGRELRSFKGHTDEVRAVAFSPDGNELASASTDATVRVWDAASAPRPRALQSRSLRTYGGDVECLAFSPDGRRLVSGHDDAALRVWELPSGRLLTPLKGHSRRISCVAFSPDGRTIASAGEDRSVRLWDAATGQPGLTFNGHTDELEAVVFTPDGKTVISGGHDGTIHAWDPTSGVVRYVLRGHSGLIHDLAVSPDGRTLASASHDKTCILWDLADRRPRVTLRGHTGRINTVAFNSSGQTLATASDDRTVRLWDAADGSPLGMLEGHIDRVDGLAFSPDGRLASSADDRTIRLWDTTSAQTLLVLKGHAARIRRIKFSPDGRTLASASYDRTLKLWEAAPEAALAAARIEAAPDIGTEPARARTPSTGEKLRPAVYAAGSNLALAAWEANDMGRLRFLLDLMKPRLDEPDLRGWEWHYLNRLAHVERFTFRGHDREVSQVGFSPNGRTVASVQWGGVVKLWNPATGWVRHVLEPQSAGINNATQPGVSALDFSRDGARLAGPGPNTSLGIWDTLTGGLLVHFSVSSTRSRSVAFSPDGRTIVTGSASQKVRIWNTADGRLERLFENAHDRPLQRVVFSPDGRRVASAGDGTIKLWDVEAGKLHAALPCPNAEVFGLALSPDGGTLVSGGSDALVRIWDAGTGRQRSQFSGHTGTIASVAISPDGRRVASAGSDGVVRLWDIDSGRLLQAFKGHTDQICSVAFSPDGNTIASSGLDRTVKLWDANRIPQPLVLKSSSIAKDGVSSDCVACSPDGRRIATGYTDGAVRVWDAATGLVQWTLTGHDRPVRCVAFSPDGQSLASCAQDQTVRLWDLATGRLRTRIADHRARVNGVAFSPDGRRLVSCSDDGTLKVSNPESGRCIQTIPAQTKSVLAAEYSPDGRSIASAGCDGRIRLWDAGTGKLRATIAGRPDLAIDLAFSPDGRTIASTSSDKTVMLWDTATGQHRGTLEGHTARVDSVAFSPDGRRLVSSGHDQTIRLWDLASGQDLLTLRGHSGWVRSVAFSGDGRLIASASDDGAVIVWDASTQAQRPAEHAGPGAPTSR